MKRFIIAGILMIFSISIVKSQHIPASSYTLDLARSFSKDIFDVNGVPYLSPMVETVNATSNSRFYSSAYVPRKVRKPYFKISINGMSGIVREDQKTYRPTLPTDTFATSNLTRYGTFAIDLINPEKSQINIVDTAGLINYLFKTVLYDGVKTGQLITPERASTVLGKDTTHLRMDNSIIQSLVKNHVIYQFLPQGIKDTLLMVMGQIPSFYTLPAGGNLNTIVAGVPQFEIGSLFGTELLLRFVPPMDLGKYVGKFAFWGIGVKHSLSQYFFDEANFDIDNPFEMVNPAPFDLAVQFVYQGTHLHNKVGITQSDLKADASIYNVNVHFSKSFKDIIDVYSGFAFNHINITSRFKYFLPVETQLALGLLRLDPDSGQIMPPEPPEYPGDTQPQTTRITLEDSSLQWNIGVRKAIGPVSIYLDYNISRFNIFSGGLEYRF